MVFQIFLIDENTNNRVHLAFLLEVVQNLEYPEIIIKSNPKQNVYKVY